MTALERPVSELMQREVVTLQQSDRLDLAEDIMRLGRIRHLPVLEGEQLVGLLSSRDLLAASLSRALDFDTPQRRAFMRAVEVKEVMTDKIETIGPDEPADEAARRMLRLQVGCLPVVDEHGAFVGLITETDLLRAAIELESEGGDVVETRAVSEGAESGKGGAEDRGRYQDEIDQLRRVRDELRVQVHLGKAEAGELWDKLERRFAEAEARAKVLARRAEEPVQDVAEALRLLIDEIRGGYQKLRDML